MECYNQHLKALAGSDDTWFTAAWLFAECYLYVRFLLALLLSADELRVGTDTSVPSSQRPNSGTRTTRSLPQRRKPTSRVPTR